MYINVWYYVHKPAALQALGANSGAKPVRHRGMLVGSWQAWTSISLFLFLLVLSYPRVFRKKIKR